ncbi:hypothetical protein QTP70_026209 [Hemibagrus guttatus]|uniref:Uncharacterized protein n=1 Tax=Hemibagrus guttatus TaxID=175788 RepID=A0AAE0UU83_9TELE|nr:hypothetical protein QTP70_026209 [Hemibagrus guttatus]KAK3545061.1 hypothetical protein QTP86_033250 [Hemibagrus guttatus]
MQSCASASGRLGSLSPPLCLSLTHGSGLVESAIEHFIIRNDFHAAFEACEKGLESLNHADEQELNCSRHGELKAALCIVGIQALAELNQWHDVLKWVLQHYGETEQIPAKIMQMCHIAAADKFNCFPLSFPSILLYTKVAEQAAVQEAVRTWLLCNSNTSLSGYSSVAELYILHVLLPLGQTTEAKELLMDAVGQVAFTEAQRQTALTILENHDAKKMNHSYPNPEPIPVDAKKMISQDCRNEITPCCFRVTGAEAECSYEVVVQRTLFGWCHYLVTLYSQNCCAFIPALPAARTDGPSFALSLSMDPQAVWTLAADVECHVWTILQDFFLKNPRNDDENTASS